MDSTSVILVDSREQISWKFPSHKTMIKALKTGDYSIEGLEDKFVIERKGSIAEWAGNITQKRFIKELDRLSQMDHPYIFLEFNMHDVLNFPYTSNIPKFKWKYIKIQPAFILKQTLQFQLDYNVNILMVGPYGQKTALSLFNRMVEKYGKVKAQ